MTWPMSDFATFDAAPRLVSEARNYAVGLLHRWGYPAGSELSEEVRIVVSELFTNAVKVTHALVPTPATPVVQLRVSTDRHTVLVEVADRSKAPPYQLIVNEDAVSGRGIMLVSIMAKQWSYYFTNNGGKVVWAQIEIK